jgi:hypothetical protein
MSVVNCTLKLDDLLGGRPDGCVPERWGRPVYHSKIHQPMQQDSKPEMRRQQ